jgi:hypothetical protein
MLAYNGSHVEISIDRIVYLDFELVFELVSLRSLHEKEHAFGSVQEVVTSPGLRRLSSLNSPIG